MTETELALLESGSGTFAATGIMSFTLGPRDLSRWEIALFAWSTTATGMARLDIYRGPASANNLLDHTNRLSDISPTDIKLYPGEFITIQATGGTVGAIGTLRVEGRRYVKGRRAYGV